MRWADHIRLIFVSVSSRRLRRVDCPATGGGAVWFGYQYGDQLGAAAARDRQRGSRPDGGPQTESDFRLAPRVAFAAGAGEGLHDTGVGR